MKKLILSIIFACIITFTPSAFAVTTENNIYPVQTMSVHFTGQELYDSFVTPIPLLPVLIEGHYSILRYNLCINYVAPTMTSGLTYKILPFSLSSTSNTYGSLNSAILQATISGCGDYSVSGALTSFSVLQEAVYLKTSTTYGTITGSSYDLSLQYQIIGGDIISSGGGSGSPMATGDILDFLSSSNFLLGSLFANILVLALLPLLLVVIFIRFIKRYL